MPSVTDVSPGSETRGEPRTLHVPHDVSAGGEYAVEPGDVVSVDASGNVKKVAEGETVAGVVYSLPRDADNNVTEGDAVLVVGGLVKAKVSGNVTAGSALGAPDTTNGASTGAFDDSGQANSSDQGARAYEVADGYAEVRV